MLYEGILFDKVAMYLIHVSKLLENALVLQINVFDILFAVIHCV